MRSQAEVERVQIWETVGVKIFGREAYVGVQSVLHSLRRVCRRSVLLENVIWFLSNILDTWKNLYL